jgi:hypothetical protein
MTETRFSYPWGGRDWSRRENGPGGRAKIMSGIVWVLYCEIPPGFFAPATTAATGPLTVPLRDAKTFKTYQDAANMALMFPAYVPMAIRKKDLKAWKGV